MYSRVEFGEIFNKLFMWLSLYGGVSKLNICISRETTYLQYFKCTSTYTTVISPDKNYCKECYILDTGRQKKLFVPNTPKFREFDFLIPRFTEIMHKTVTTKYFSTNMTGKREAVTIQCGSPFYSVMGETGVQD